MINYVQSDVDLVEQSSIKFTSQLIKVIHGIQAFRTAHRAT